MSNATAIECGNYQDENGDLICDDDEFVRKVEKRADDLARSRAQRAADGLFRTIHSVDYGFRNDW